MYRNLKFIVAGLAVLVGVGCGVRHFTEPSLDEMVGQMIMTGFHGDGSDKNTEDFVAITSQIQQGQIGGVILFDVDVSGLAARGITGPDAKKYIFSSNIKNMNQVKDLVNHLQSLSPNLLLVAIDQEGGRVQRLKPEHGFASIPSAQDLALGDVDNTYKTAYDLGKRLSELGINVDFAPLADVNVNPASPAIGAMGRSFSSDPDMVIKYAGAFARGLSDAGIAYSYKHFPGHGSAGTDTHAGLTDVTNTYQDYELTPWRGLLHDASPYTMVMVAHVVNKNFDDVPASLSPRVIGMVREMGFDGVIVSDDMDMGAIVNEYGRDTAIEMAINAGNDILVFGNNLTFDKNRGAQVHSAIMQMVRDGKISKSRIRESYNRIRRMKNQLNNIRNKS